MLKSLKMAVRLGGGGGGMAKAKIMAKVKYVFSTNERRNTFRLILIGKSISYIIFLIQGHLQCQKVNLKVK